tara:strand:+ start:919 stop:1236 length:318 start_codon:yes stop_codon:yes gene_type:complete
MSFLIPDKNNNFLKNYHKSSKFLLPLTISSLVTQKYNLQPYDKAIIVPNIFCFAYHSYVSTSCVISDYIKIPKIDTFIRVLNFKTHSIATVGFLYYIFKKHKKDL